MAAPSMLTSEELARFRYHPSTSVTAPRHELVRQTVIDAAELLCSVVPAGRHRSLALTALQEAMMWANAGVAIDSDPPA